MFVAVTVNEYAVPFVRPVTVHEVTDAVHDAPPGLAIARYELIAAPPFEAGADHVTRARASPAAADTLNGADGTTGLDTGVTVTTPDGGLVPKRFTARTRTDTGTSGVSPRTVARVAVDTPSA